MEKKPFYFVILLFALISCLMHNLIATLLVIGSLIAFATFKLKNKDLTIKLIQPALFTIVFASFKGIFNIVIGSFFNFIWYACGGSTSFMSSLYDLTYFTNLVADFALVAFVIIGIVSFAKGKNITVFGTLAEKCYGVFIKEDNENKKDEADSISE